MNIVTAVVVAWILCGFLNVFGLWLYHQAYLAHKPWGEKSKDTDMLAFFVSGSLGTLLLSIGLTIDLWKRLIGPALTKQVLFKPKPVAYPAKGEKCTTGLRSDRV